MSNKEVRLRLDLKGDEARQFLYVQNQLGLKNATEVVRFLVHREFEVASPMLEHHNLGGDGVKILDRSIPWVVDLSFKREGIKCHYCKSDSCRHIVFALTVPEVKEVIRKRRKDGWDLPEV